jgi:glucose-1-phosphate cytidylyltransferase
MKAVILAGGLGTRLREESEYKPKPLVEIGNKPIIWHIMKFLNMQDINSFIICLGYKGDLIKDYFINYKNRNNDISINTKSGKVNFTAGIPFDEDWQVSLTNTGLSTNTGGRIFQIKDQVKNERFLCTYGDGLANINLSELLRFHNAHGKIATVTAVKPRNRFGALEIDKNSRVSAFFEKPESTDFINGGYFIFEPKIFDYLSENCILEKEPLETLVNDGQLMAYQHLGFWQPMDTYREVKELNELWDSQSAPWKNWK